MSKKPNLSKLAWISKTKGIAIILPKDRLIHNEKFPNYVQVELTEEDVLDINEFSNIMNPKDKKNLDDS
tara:strand:+ start:623 stop:829 length:207 start_codon:yes stop_codon:yes gene_type:complete